MAAASWPRLVRWQTQDADAAQLRDQLRQAALLWQERGRPRDLLWVGSSYRELAVWLEIYPGGLTAAEQAFVRAAKEHAGRRRRRRRVAVAAAVLMLAGVTAAVTGLWQKSEHYARRAESRRLYQVGKQWLRSSPPTALAYAIASLRLTDDPEVRRLALRAMADAPMPFVVGSDQLPGLAVNTCFSPDGQWLAASHFEGAVALWPSSGGAPRVWQAAKGLTAVWISPDSSTLVSAGASDSVLTLWSIPDGQRLTTVERQDGVVPGVVEGRAGNNLVRLVRIVADQASPGGWTVDERPQKAWRQLQHTVPRLATSPDGGRLVVAKGADLYEVEVAEGQAGPRFLARSPAAVEHLAFHPGGELFATVDVEGSARVWSLTGAGAEPLWEFQGPRDDVCHDLRFDPSGRFLATTFDNGFGLIWGLDDPPGADPLRLSPAGNRMVQIAFHPEGRWLATASMLRLGVWPFDRSRYPWVLRGHSARVEQVAFEPDGRVLISAGTDGTVRRWPLRSEAGARPSVLLDWGHRLEGGVGSMSMSPDGRFVVSTGGESAVRVVPLDGGPARALAGFEPRVFRAAAAPDGRSVAISGVLSGRMMVRIWDLATGEDAVLDVDEVHRLGPQEFSLRLEYTADGRLLVADSETLALWDPGSGQHTILRRGVAELAISRDGETLISLPTADRPGMATVHDLEAGTEMQLTTHGPRVLALALDATGTIAVTGGVDGVVRVGRVTGEEPHHLVGHRGAVVAVAVSPDGRWIASGGEDGTIRVWPMPDLETPPLHLLPHSDLVVHLERQTNLRVVVDEQHPKGHVKALDTPPVWD